MPKASLVSTECMSRGGTVNGRGPRTLADIKQAAAGDRTQQLRDKNSNCQRRRVPHWRRAQPGRAWVALVAPWRWQAGRVLAEAPCLWCFPTAAGARNPSRRSPELFPLCPCLVLDSHAGLAPRRWGCPCRLLCASIAGPPRWCWDGAGWLSTVIGCGQGLAEVRPGLGCQSGMRRDLARHGHAARGSGKPFGVLVRTASHLPWHAVAWCGMWWRGAGEDMFQERRQ